MGELDLISVSEIEEKADISRQTVKYYIDHGLVQEAQSVGRFKLYHRSAIDQIIKIKAALKKYRMPIVKEAVKKNELDKLI